MPDILHDFPIRAPADRVYAGFTAPAGLDRWWTARSAGHPEVGTEYQLFFEPNCDWRAVVTAAEPGNEASMVRFYHSGWREANGHFRVSSCCWAMYLRILRRWLEHGESVPYPERLDA